ncbi:hypothetical protein [Solibacillus sp. NPDC093137]|uniref:hypothetical protein n=1 Tax=Solibacillus sp. NPDC093137 TaxID=3390678 RepID=UPI003CFE6B6E
MKKSFYIDLGQKSKAEVIIERSEGYTLKDFMNEIKDSGDWFEVNNRSIQVKYIKQVIEVF